MKKQRVFGTGLLALGLFIGIILMTGQAMAAEPTMGAVVNEMAKQVGMTPEALTAILFPLGVTGLDKAATSANIAQLYLAVDSAIAAGSLTGNASTLVNTAATNAGVSASVITQGISSGTTLAAAATTRGGGTGGAGGGTGGGAGGGGGGGGGEVFSKSR